jgi:hypothetical protein
MVSADFSAFHTLPRGHFVRLRTNRCFAVGSTPQMGQAHGLPRPRAAPPGGRSTPPPRHGRGRGQMKPVRERLTYANVVALLALFVALGPGTAYAADKIRSKDIARGAVKAPKIARGAVEAPKIVRGAVKGPKIARGAVGSAKLLDGVTLEKLAEDGGGAPVGWRRGDGHHHRGGPLRRVLGPNGVRGWAVRVVRSRWPSSAWRADSARQSGGWPPGRRRPLAAGPVGRRFVISTPTPDGG